MKSSRFPRNEEASFAENAGEKGSFSPQRFGGPWRPCRNFLFLPREGSASKKRRSNGASSSFRIS
jgi:hypothetical protein